MDIKELVTVLANKSQIVDKDIPNGIFDELNEESFSSDDNFITVKNGEDVISIDFELYVNWKVVNSGGDGYWTPNYDEAEDIEVKIEITNIEDYDNDKVIELNDKESIKEVEKWVENQLSLV